MQMYTTLQIVSVRLREANYDHELYHGIRYGELQFGID